MGLKWRMSIPTELNSQIFWWLLLLLIKYVQNIMKDQEQHVCCYEQNTMKYQEQCVCFIVIINTPTLLHLSTNGHPPDGHLIIWSDRFGQRSHADQFNGSGTCVRTSR